MKIYKVNPEIESADIHKGQKGELVAERFGVLILLFEDGKTGSYLKDDISPC